MAARSARSSTTSSRPTRASTWRSTTGHLYAHEIHRCAPKRRALRCGAPCSTSSLRCCGHGRCGRPQVQLANLLAEAGDYVNAARLYQEAGRGGNTDALFHLGMLYWAGKGVPASAKTAFALWQSSDFKSKHAKLEGLQKPLFGLARFIVEFRAFLLFAAGIAAIVTSGGDPLTVLRRALSGGNSDAADVYGDDFDDGEEDLFGGDD